MAHGQQYANIDSNMQQATRLLLFNWCCFLASEVFETADTGILVPMKKRASVLCCQIAQSSREETKVPKC